MTGADLIAAVALVSVAAFMGYLEHRHAKGEGRD
ncbi:MAG: hypothetical protein GAK38_00797 [Xylophilus sp.]|nr:MAG: hypothetical protein GAK38_00797 [Xylophilus sp.]